MANVLSFACREVTWFRVRSVHSSHFNTIRCGLDLLWLVGKSEEYRRHQHKTRFLQREPFVFFLRFFCLPPWLCTKKMQVWMYYLDVFFVLVDYLRYFCFLYFVLLLRLLVLSCKCIRARVLTSTVRVYCVISPPLIENQNFFTLTMEKLKKYNINIVYIQVFEGTFLKIKAITNQEGSLVILMLREIVSTYKRPKHVINIQMIFSWSVGSEMSLTCVDMRMCSVVSILTPVLQRSCFVKIVGSC